MALNANALVSLAEAAAALGLLTPTDDAITEPLVNQASQLAESTYTKRVLKKRTYTNLRLVGPMSQRLYAPTWPIDTAATITISVDGAVQSVWKSEADGDPAGFNVLAFPEYFSRYLGWRTGGVIAENVVATFDAGYATVPDDLKEAVLELVQKLYGPMVNRTQDVGSIAAGGTSMQTIDGVIGGVATSTYALSKRSRDVFDGYRIWRVN
jgi:hypothetical protein